MKSEKRDRRSRRTQELIIAALIALMAEKRYNAITVQDILERADVGRSTFYTHFYDKEDVLVSSVSRMLEALRQQVKGEHDSAAPIVPSLALFRHVQEHRYLYEALVKGRGVEVLFERITLYFGQMIETYLTRQEPPAHSLEVPAPVVATYMTGALLTLLRWWLDHQVSYTAEEMDSFFWRLAPPGMDLGWLSGAPGAGHAVDGR